MFDAIDAALADIKAGKAVVVVDDENRENEGDLICAAQFATPALVNFMAVEARGLICLAMTGDRLDELDLPLMVSKNTDSNQTAFTVSIDAAPHLGVTTGISAEDRARTIQIAINPVTRPEDLSRPGHIFPLRAKTGGVLKRAGHTEAAVDLSRLAGLYPAGVICEIQNADGSMARLPELVEYARKYDLKLISIADLISYRLQHDRFVQRETICEFPSQFGEFKLYAYRNLLDQTEHIAIVKGDPSEFGQQPVMVRMHSECLTGDALGSLRCDCRMQLQAALKMLENHGLGVVVYLRQEGRGIGLVNKLKAYSLQDLGYDTVEANERLGFPADLRDYGMGAQMLNDLGVKQIRLITNNPRKIAGLKGYGLEIVERVPLLIEANDYNSHYLTTKAEKLGHWLVKNYLLAIAIKFTPNVASAQQRYEKLEKIRALLQGTPLMVHEDNRPVAIALFGKNSLIFHVGLDQNLPSGQPWQKHDHSPYPALVKDFLVQLKQWPDLQALAFLIAQGKDPMETLQVSLDRENVSFADLTADALNQWQPQTVYTYSKQGSGEMTNR
ncbi:GTP cyclohydrolase II [Synechocystis sp. PCC 6803]|uniref:Riboflavin biosynthesis protein RibBA n=1 Tax=Synechocystis sp. (strain ATCC 27184 / PCC 6803 / Kazusa) TaxID=1111708 RepID=RIBBA_SYNY3|nr:MULTISPECIES: bifunctional 3,4-dihydroxy-2-butanone-4-phosphate synthase/GTP cyclohydrolase II [unclassified Synechocystis]P74104.1 RecName: Full=Riboflavin biosynthesis protein RibBA; Includes: RecName: Full=3,4-dihydroxy-2-butanone 4-phosphate synthase; Short=DHBP synthase; Includes: RecName: Full=GTP cyclohydrolase-2; AltName: Full=GTP cyclohydrolase II [Synechocystis sp. PCC 6803 substr. Kazusa]BAM55100.1 bifunctional 3,4-dihydroxy-2-butanone4-phosphate synthase/GTP cyclohydrolase II [Syne